MRDTLSLYRMAEEGHIDVDWFPMERAQSVSMPLGKRYAVALDPHKVVSRAEERVRLGHELGHCFTCSFYDRHAAREVRRRYERRADRWAIGALIPRGELDSALEGGLREVWELAEHFEVTEDFMRKALDHYGLLEGEPITPGLPL